MIDIYLMARIHEIMRDKNECKHEWQRYNEGNMMCIHCGKYAKIAHAKLKGGESE